MELDVSARAVSALERDAPVESPKPMDSAIEVTMTVIVHPRLILFSYRELHTAPAVPRQDEGQLDGCPSLFRRHGP